VSIRAAIVRLEHSTEGVIDRTAVLFLMQLARAAVYVIAAILYAHLVLVLHAIGTVMLTGRWCRVGHPRPRRTKHARQSNRRSSTPVVPAVSCERPPEDDGAGGAVTGVVEELTLGYGYKYSDGVASDLGDRDRDGERRRPASQSAGPQGDGRRAATLAWNASTLGAAFATICARIGEVGATTQDSQAVVPTTSDITLLGTVLSRPRTGSMRGQIPDLRS
jgi:hypothetical protein